MSPVSPRPRCAARQGMKSAGWPWLLRDREIAASGRPQERPLIGPSGAARASDHGRPRVPRAPPAGPAPVLPLFSVRLSWFDFSFNGTRPVYYLNSLP